MARIEIDQNVTQARFGIDPDNNLGSVEPLFVSKHDREVVTIWSAVSAGQPVIGRIAAVVAYDDENNRYKYLVEQIREMPDSDFRRRLERERIALLELVVDLRGKAIG